MAIKTLDEMNSNPRFSEWPFQEPEYKLEHRAAVGRVGRSRSGEKIHFLNTQIVVEYLNGFTPDRRQYRIGDSFSTHAPCNGNGQQVGQIIRNLDTNAITCQKCLKALGE